MHASGPRTSSHSQHPSPRKFAAVASDLIFFLSSGAHAFAHCDEDWQVTVCVTHSVHSLGLSPCSIGPMDMRMACGGGPCITMLASSSCELVSLISTSPAWMGYRVDGHSVCQVSREDARASCWGHFLHASGRHNMSYGIA